MLSPDDARTFTNKLHRLKGDLDYFIGRIEAPYNDPSETDKRRYCSVIIEMMEFVVRRIEHLPPEISLPETKYKTWDSTIQNLRRENANLKEQLNEEKEKLKKLRHSRLAEEHSSKIEELKSKINRLQKDLDKEKSNSRRTITPFGNHRNMKRVGTSREVLEVENIQGYDAKEREVELEAENGILKSQIQELKHFSQNLETERKALLDRLSELSTTKPVIKNSAKEPRQVESKTSSSVSRRYSDLFSKDWSSAYRVLMTVLKTDRKVAFLLLQCLINAFNICKSKADQQRRKLHEENLTEGLLDPNLIKDTPRQIIEMQVKSAPETLPEITQICRDRISKLSSYPPEVTQYVDSCAEICWFMVIQNPPFSLSWEAPPGEMVDTSKFNFYRTSGRYVDFVVWPVLYDQNGSTVIAKGVVQGRN
ncbi:putative protein tag-278 [Saccostrea cucullata]|uniref:putative protein tag-278 n=1 Tax=Saccostrea cuccullata TaxID=36930 RepID=UPI002ED04E57